MNVNLTWGCGVGAIIAIENSLVPNTYEFEFDLITNTEILEEQHIYFQRLKWYMEAHFNCCVLINFETPAFDLITEHFNQIIFQTNQPPSDFTVGAMLFLKLSRILNNKIILNKLAISSGLGEYIKYSITGIDIADGTNTAPWMPAGSPPWWMRNDTSINDIATKELITWESINLGLASELKKFTPTVIPGGKNET